jgi:hypothetical protein
MFEGMLHPTMPTRHLPKVKVIVKGQGQTKYCPKKQFLSYTVSSRVLPLPLNNSNTKHSKFTEQMAVTAAGTFCKYSL